MRPDFLSNIMKHKHNHSAESSYSRKSRKKAFWLLVILGIIVMIVYAVSFQGAEDSELIQETEPQAQQ